MNHIGIDLGTTNSVACTMKDGRFSFLDFRRTDLLPSVMMYQNGKVTVGEPAKRKREIFPNNYISSAKTHMGEQTADGKLKPVAVIEGRSFTATDVATEVLSEIYRVARKFFGNEEPIEAVITTPAYFDSVQNRETQKAGEAAGFQIKQILAEPVAAALAYALDDCHPGEKIFVVDLGGGTFDVTLLETKGNSQFDVIWKAGDNHLGGDDFDNAILEIMYRHIRLTTGTDVSEQGSSGLSDEDYGKMLQKLRREAERCKCELPVHREGIDKNNYRCADACCELGQDMRKGGLYAVDAFYQRAFERARGLTYNIAKRHFRQLIKCLFAYYGKRVEGRKVRAGC